MRLAVILILLLIASAVVLAATNQQPGSDQINAATVQANAALAYERQVHFYQTKLQQNPEDAMAHNLLGMSYQGLERLEDAIKEYRQATKLNPRYSEAWNNLGSAYHVKKNLKQAVKHYRKAIEVNPDLSSAHRNLGTALLAMGKIDAGLDSYRKAFALNPAIFVDGLGSATVQEMDSGMQYFCFAKISAASGRIDDALGFLQKARLAGFRDFKKVEKDSDFEKVVATERYHEVKTGAATMAQSE